VAEADLRSAITKTNTYISALPMERKLAPFADTAEGQK
jgi:hypothetical protein